MTFAYWNPDFLSQRQLLNQQTGEYVDVEVEQLGTESLEVRGEAVIATRFIGHVTRCAIKRFGIHLMMNGLHSSRLPRAVRLFAMS